MKALGAHPPPGAWRPSLDRWARTPSALRPALEGPALALCDERVLRLHPWLEQALGTARLVPLKAGEALKSLAQVERLLAVARDLPRGAAVLAVGGGTVGDVATVFAHLFKRGAGRLVHVPTTLLAAVDSSVGGKGAVNAAGVKNALGVFHAADEAWLCPPLWETLSPAQLREGRLEAFKVGVTVGPQALWRRPDLALEPLVRLARAAKTEVVARDPYDVTGRRVVLNFGHTFGHVLESVTGYRVRHGEAVGLGVLCALDVGRALGVTPDTVADAVESALPLPRGRARLAAALRGVGAPRVRGLLAADKKSGAQGLSMVLLERPGRWRVAPVPEGVWRGLLPDWRRAVAPTVG